MKHPGMTNSIQDSKDINFEWSKENFNKIENLLGNYPHDKIQSAVIPVMQIAQNQNEGWLSKKALEKIAETLSMSFIRVLEIATFYSMFNLEPVGKYFIQICRTTPCWLKGSKKILEIAKEFTNTDIGTISKDNLFTVVEVECLGACCNAPMVQINNDYYEDLDEKNFKELLINLKNCKPIIKGSQIGRKCSEPVKNKNNA